jgi:peptide/nickel transport system ATP-binding protein
MPESPPLLEVRDLTKSYVLRGGFFDTARGSVRAVDRVTFSIGRGRTFGLVGESGCGKTTTARLILRVIEPDAGEIVFRDPEMGRVDLCTLSARKMRPLRRKIQMIFQDPYASLDPRMTVLRIVGEPLRASGLTDLAATRKRVAEVLELVGLRYEYMNRYPHAFSGGQRQRIGIARALATQPHLVVADEAVSALDVSVQAQILNLLRDLQGRLNLTYLFIAHDLGVVRYICDSVGVMYVGRLVEVADKASLFANPRHPYTEALLAAAPRPEPGWRIARRTSSEPVLAADAPAPGCPYYGRCLYKKEVCAREAPELRQLAPGHTVACHFDLQLTGVASPAQGDSISSSIGDYV